MSASSSVSNRLLEQVKAFHLILLNANMIPSTKALTDNDPVKSTERSLLPRPNNQHSTMRQLCQYA